MAVTDLIRMANQIAANFAPYPEDEAVEAIATHFHNFWTPEMRADLRAALAEGRAEALDARARLALARL